MEREMEEDELGEGVAPEGELAEPPRINREMPAAKIAEKFGGIVAFATALGKAPSTCHRWLVSGLIPAKHQSAVLAAARRYKIKMKADDFIPPEEPVQDAA